MEFPKDLYLDHHDVKICIRTKISDQDIWCFGKNVKYKNDKIAVHSPFLSVW
jgi:hypothetical protein